MLRGFVIVGLIMFSVSVLSASAEMWRDSFDGAALNEMWKPGVSVAGNPPTDWKIEDGILKGHWANFGQQLLLIEYPSSDYTIQVKCRLDEANNAEGGAGIVFRSYGPGHDPSGWQGTSEFYVFQILRRNLNLWRIGAGSWDTIVVEPPIGGADEHSDTEWYTLRLVVKGSNFRGYANDELLFEIQDDTFKGDFVGIGMGLFTDASFDDFVVTDETLASVSPQGTLMTTWAGLKKQ